MSSKRRHTEQLNKDAVEDDDVAQDADADPGAWVADPGAIKARRKVHVRRGGQSAAAAPPAEDTPAASEAVPAAPSNPFAGVSLVPSPASSNPFAGVNLTAPVQTTTQDANTQVKPEPTETAAKAEATEPTTGSAPADAEPKQDKPASNGDQSATPAASTGGFASLGGSTGNPFASLGTTKAFTGFGSSGGGFGAVAASGSTFGAFGGAAAATGAQPTLGAFTASSFTFGTSTFPPVSAVPLHGTSAGGAAADGGEEDGEGGEEGADGSGQGMALFGNAAVQPVVSLPEQEKRTGEEEEQVVFSGDGGLFEFDSTAKQWRERGRGEFKVNVTGADNGRQQARMVMRQAANLRLLLNAKVYEGMPLQLMTGNVGVTFGVVNAAAPSTGSATSETARPEGAVATDATAVSPASTASPAGATVKPTTWAVKIKHADKVQALHELLARLKSTSSSTQEDPASAV